MSRVNTKPVVVSLYLDKEANVMFDCNGVTVYDIYNYVTPNQLYLFKTKQESMSFVKDEDLVVELIYPYLEY